MKNEFFMREALNQAKKALLLNEIPIGAVAVFEGEIIAQAHNLTITNNDPSAHSEILVLREAGKVLQNHRLLGLEIYVSVEPCLMCIGAMLQARIKKLVFGTYNSKGGCVGSSFDFVRNNSFNHQIKEIYSGVLETEAKALMQDFFKNKRKISHS